MKRLNEGLMCPGCPFGYKPKRIPTPKNKPTHTHTSQELSSPSGTSKDLLHITGGNQIACASQKLLTFDSLNKGGGGRPKLATTFDTPQKLLEKEKPQYGTPVHTSTNSPCSWTAKQAQVLSGPSLLFNHLRGKTVVRGPAGGCTRMDHQRSTYTMRSRSIEQACVLFRG